MQSFFQHNQREEFSLTKGFTDGSGVGESVFSSPTPLFPVTQVREPGRNAIF